MTPAHGPAADGVVEAIWLTNAQVQRCPPKPQIGQPCNGCGYCCAAERCQIATDHIGAGDGPCPAMVFTGDRIACGMILYPSRYAGTPAWSDEFLGGMIAEALGAGRGCDADDFDDGDSASSLASWAKGAALGREAEGA